MYEPSAGLLTPQEIYRVASEPKALPDNFAQSLRAYVFFLERGHEVYDFETDNRYSPAWGTALRAAIGEVEFWNQINLYDSSPIPEAILRRIAQELCRDTVPREERLL